MWKLFGFLLVSRFGLPLGDAEWSWAAESPHHALTSVATSSRADEGLCCSYFCEKVDWVVWDGLGYADWEDGI